MVDLSVLNFEPVSLSSVKNSNGDGITFESQLDPFLKSDSLDADKLAQKIQEEAEKLPDKAKQLELVERSIAYIRAKGRSDLSLKVYENLKDEDKTNGFLDVFGKADKVPDIVKSNETAQAAWNKIASGAAYDYIEKNKTSITKNLSFARSEANDKNILKVSNPALVNLKEQLMESGMSPEEADKDISKMLRETNGFDGKKLLNETESVQIEMDSPSNTLSADRTKKLENLRDELTASINKAKTPEEVKQILKESVKAFEKLKPDGIETERFYTEQMQEILKKSDKYKDYTVAAVPSLEKITVDGKKLITTNQDKVYVNSDGKFVNSRGKEIAIKDIEPSKPEISILMDKEQNKVEDETLKSQKEYIKDKRLVYEATGNERALRGLDKVEEELDKTEEALKERRKREEKEGKNDNNNTLSLIVGIVSALATIVAALSQGGGRTTTITGGGAYNPQGGGYNGQNGLYPVSDKYGYNRGYQATVDAAYERSNQYLSTFYNNPVKTRATIMRQNGMAAIDGRNGGPGVYGYINATRY